MMQRPWKLLALEDPGRLGAGPPGLGAGLDKALGHSTHRQGATVFVPESHVQGGRGCGDGVGRGLEGCTSLDRFSKSVALTLPNHTQRCPGLLLTGQVK